MEKAKGNGLSECYLCKKNNKYSLTWTSFLYRTYKDNFKYLYCFDCCKKIEGGNIIE